MPGAMVGLVRCSGSIEIAGVSCSGTYFTALREGTWGALGGGKPRPYGQFRQSEIEDLRLAEGSHKDICRLDAVRRVQLATMWSKSRHALFHTLAGYASTNSSLHAVFQAALF